jgi:integrase
VLVWRADLEHRRQAGATTRRGLAAVASLCDRLLNSNSVTRRQPGAWRKPASIETNKSKTPALGDHQAKALLDAPDPNTIKGKRDRRFWLYCFTTACALRRLCS